MDRKQLLHKNPSFQLEENRIDKSTKSLKFKVSVFLMTQLFGKRETAFTEDHCDSELLTMKQHRKSEMIPSSKYIQRKEE
ncbi:uncharacterized protein GJ701_002384 [Geothlypis trichas]